jgi:DNA replication protein DnaC
LSNTHPKVLEACNAVKAFGFDWFQHKRSRRLVLAGHSGCGKTQLAKALYRWASAASMLAWEKRHWSKPPGCGFLLWQEVCDRLEDSRSSMVDLLSDAVTEPLLIVDDIGAESDRFKSGKGVDALGYLLTRRQDSGFTMLTTNVLPDEWHARWDERVRDRLLRESTVVDMSECPSWAAL